MEQKVLNRIHWDSSHSTDSLKAAQKAKFDEFYTPLQTVSDELIRWGDKLKGKNIICPCDWDILDSEDCFSITIEFDTENPKPSRIHKNDLEYHVKRVVYNSISDVPSGLFDEKFSDKYKPQEVVTTLDNEEEIENLLRGRITCNFIKCLVGLGRKHGIKSITASGYDVNTGRGVRFQDLDYSNYDVCITNPPFSLLKEFIEKMLEVKKQKSGNFDFIVLAPLLNRVSPNFGLYLMLGEVYLGYNRGINVRFSNPSEGDEKNYKVVGVDWVTTFSDAQEEVDDIDIDTFYDYEMYKDEFYEMENITMKDGTHPIRINLSSAIPSNYDGWMFGAIGILDKLSNKKWEWYGTNFKKYFNSTNPEASPFAHKASDEMVSHNGKRQFHGIVFRRRKTSI